MAKARSKQDFWRSRQGNAVAALASFLTAYALASRALDTGSLIQYFLAFMFLGLAINRLIKVIHK